MVLLQGVAAGTQGAVLQVFHFTIVESAHLGTVPSADTLRSLGLPEIPAPEEEQPATVTPVTNPLAAILPFLTALPIPPEGKEKQETQPVLYLVAKGLPTLPCKQVEKVWGLEFVDMEDFLPAPRSLRLAEQGTAAPSFQESLVGALNGRKIEPSGHRCRHLGEMFHPLYCSDGQEKGGNGAEYGVPPAYRAKTLSESSRECGVARV